MWSLVMMMFLTVKIYYRLPPAGKSVNYRMVEKKILDRILSPSIYDSQIRPKAQNFCLNVGFYDFCWGNFQHLRIYINCKDEIDVDCNK